MLGMHHHVKEQANGYIKMRERPISIQVMESRWTLFVHEPKEKKKSHPVSPPPTLKNTEKTNNKPLSPINQRPPKRSPTTTTRDPKKRGVKLTLSIDDNLLC